jgi:hypothetical protein
MVICSMSKTTMSMSISSRCPRQTQIDARRTIVALVMSQAMSMALAAVTRRCRTAIMSIIWWTATYTIRMATIATIMGP